MHGQDIDYDNFLMHYGILRKSGRYPWGSGENPYQRNKGFLSYVEDLKRQGLSDVDIAKGLDMTTTQLRAYKSIARTANRQADISTVLRLREKGMSNVAIGERMGIPESSVRALQSASLQENSNILESTAGMLKNQLSDGGYLDIGRGVENHLGISDTKLKTAVSMLKDEGYKVFYVQVEQVGIPGQYTNIKVLAPPDTTFPDVMKNQDKIKSIAGYSEDGGRTYLGIEKPKSVSSDRVGVRYAEEGGANKDGVIELRRGVEDLSLGDSRYAQVRIAVDDSHYLKGMAMYSDNMPDGVDLIFNTNKSDTGNKLDAMKSLKDDPDNPFGSTIRQKHYIDANGKKQLSPLNIVGSESPDGETTSGEEGGWSTWNKTLSSQMLSKQSPKLAEQQLGVTYSVKKAEFDEIMSLTNPAVKRELLKSFADGVDASAVHLKAAGLPRTANHVILPINSLKDNEIYAPKYNDGETVVLIRHPHGGKFEIPELKVNNRNKEAKSVIQNAADAVGINANVAARLSGADFDGDTVLVIPNKKGTSSEIQTSPALAGLKNFDPKIEYPKYEGMPVMRGKQKQMGDVSNLITDMTIKGASQAEIARAVRHSMVVIDAEKHELNYKQSAIDHGIAELKAKYQGGPRKGASTLISKASSEQRVPVRKPRSAANGGPIDKETGEKVYEYTNESYPNKKGEMVPRLIKSTKMGEAKDAFELSSGTKMEAVYATHANKLKALGNEARKAMVAIKSTPYNPSAKTAYAKEVGVLNAKLNEALKNAPLERKAQLVANTIVDAKRKANPGMDSSDIKKVKSQALIEARVRSGAKKSVIDITPEEWNAIQAGAITNNKLTKILQNADLTKIKEYAMPRNTPTMGTAKIARARAMASMGYTQAEIASALGVSASTISKALKG